MEMLKTKARILVVDDHPLVREGLAARLALQPDLEICGEAASVDEALAQVKKTSPDLVIVDIQLADSHGLDLIQEIHRRYGGGVKMLVVSALDESLYAERALRAGAHGYIHKRELQDDIITALRAVLQGERYLSPKMTEELVGRAISGESGEGDPVHRLSDRELQVFQLIGQGKSTSEIAQQLHRSIHTIETHREKIRHKLNLKSSVELMHRAVQWVLESGRS